MLKAWEKLVPKLKAQRGREFREHFAKCAAEAKQPEESDDDEDDEDESLTPVDKKKTRQVSQVCGVTPDGNYKVIFNDGHQLE